MPLPQRGGMGGDLAERGVQIMFRLTIKMTNAAFADDPNEELARQLEKVAKQVREGYGENTVRDANGNTVGKWSVGS
jgi:hypothetical protein